MENIYYILLALAYFVYQIVKENKKAQEQQKKKMEQQKTAPASSTLNERIRPVSNTPVPNEEREEEMPVSLEDIFREFKREVQTQKEVPRQAYQEPINEKRALFTEKAEPIKEGIEHESVVLKIKTAEDEKQPDKVWGFISPKVNNPYATFLKNPQGIKTTFVVSEIFNKKYF